MPHDRFEVDAPLGRAARDPRGRHRRPTGIDSVRGSRALPAGDAARGRTTYRTRTRSGCTCPRRAPDPGDRRYGGEGTTRELGLERPSCTRGVSRSTTRSPGSGSTWRIRCPRIWRRPSGGSGGGPTRLISAGRARPRAGTGRAGSGPPRARRAGRPRCRGSERDSIRALSFAGRPKAPAPTSRAARGSRAPLLDRGGHVLRPTVDRRPVRAEEAAVPVLVGERVDERHELVEPAVRRARLSLQPDPLVDHLGDARCGVTLCLLVLVPEQRAGAWYSHQSHSGF